ncbi:hypothetical protein KCP74_16610 [Salmonella enterica subsp. enterica]|nr:hypothetical protein KCP74_16610 [Salmonella enterica subsp. enterica]
MLDRDGKSALMFARVNRYPYLLGVRIDANVMQNGRTTQGDPLTAAMRSLRAGARLFWGFFNCLPVVWQPPSA